MEPKPDIRGKAGMPRALCAWYDRAKRDLPWRRTRDPYAVWVSEVMLQQTRAETAAPYYLSFIGKWPSARSLSGAAEEDVLKAWEGLGYYSRARNLFKGARSIVKRHGGWVPCDAAALQKVPGIGLYTAGAIMSIAFDRPVPAVDANALRVFARLLTLDTAGAKLHRTVAEHIRAAMDGCSPRRFSQAVMELGALVCLPRTPDCGNCPISAHCAALAAGRTQDFPQRAAKPERRVVRLAVAIATEPGGRVLVRRRSPHGLLGGLWEFPAWEAEEDPEAAVLKGLYGAGVPGGAPRAAGVARHGFTHLVWEMQGYFVQAQMAPVRRGWAWKTPEELEPLAWPSAMRPWRERVRALADKAPAEKHAK